MTRLLPILRNLRRLIGILWLSGLAGCGNLSSTPDWDQRFGWARQQITQAQILNPQAGNQPYPPGGLDANAAIAAQQAYANGYAQDQKSHAPALMPDTH